MDLNPLTADFPQRLDFDEEQEAQAQSEPGPCSPKVLWSSAVYPALQKGRLEIAQLVIGCGRDWLALLRCVPGNLEVMGSIILPDQMLAGTCLQPNLKDSTCLIVKVAGSSGLLLLCQYVVPDDRAVSWAEALHSTVRSQQTLILASQPSRNYSIDNSEDPCCHLLSTDAAQASALAKCSLPNLPAGQLLTGLPAALLSLSQVHQLQATMLVADQAGGRLSRLRQLRLGLSALLSSLPGSWEWLNLSDAAVRQAAMDLEAASPSTRASLYA